MRAYTMIRWRKQVTQQELRQQKQQFMEANMTEPKSWEESGLYDLSGIRTHSARDSVRGRHVLTVKRD